MVSPTQPGALGLQRGIAQDMAESRSSAADGARGARRGGAGQGPLDGGEGLAYALEPRLLLDAAAVATAAEQAAQDAADSAAQEAADKPSGGGSDDESSGDGAEGSGGAPGPSDDELAQALSEVEPVASEAPGDNQGGGEVVFVDTSVADHQSLIDSLGGGVEVVALDPAGDAVLQMSAHLEGRSGLSAIHVVSHGDAGELSFGGGRLNLGNLAAYGEALGRIGQALAADGDLLLYGCYVGADGEGRAFIEALAALTGADVAAADDLTGDAGQGGDWTLESATGEIADGGVDEAFAASGFAGSLFAAGSFDFTNGTDTDGGQTVTTQSGEWVGSGANSVGTQVDVNRFDNSIFLASNPGNGAVASLSVNLTGSASPTSFVLNSVTVGEFPGTPSFENNIVITGANAGGGTTTYNYAASNLPADFQGGHSIDLTGTAFAGQAITGFTVTFDAVSTTSPATFDLRGWNVSLANAAPSISNLSGDVLAYTEGAGAQVLDQSTAAAITDDDSADFSGGSLTVSIVTNEDASEDLLSFNTGSVTLGGTTAGSNVSVGGIAIGTLANSISAGNDLVVNLNANSTAARVATLVQAVTYENTDTSSPSTAARTVRFTVNDGDGGSSSADVTVNVTGTNDAPSVTNGATATLTGITENNTNAGGTTVSSILGDVGYADPDSGAQSGIAVTAVTGNGTWQYSTDGNTWTAFGSVSGGAALLLSSSTQVRYVPDGQRGETATFGFRAWDQTSGTASTNGSPSTADSSSNGGSTAFSSNSASASIAVSDVNDAPSLTGGATATLTGTNEDTTSGGTAVSAILTAAGYADVDSGAQSGVAVTGVTGSGTWQFSTDGTTWTAFGSVSMASSLLLSSSTQVRYVPDGSNAETATFGFRAWDQTSGSASTNGSPSTASTAVNGGSTAFSSASATASLSVTAANDAPSVTNGATATLTGTNEDTTSGGTAVSTILGGVGYADVDSGAQSGIAVTAVTGNGTWQFSTDGTTWTAFGSVSGGSALLLSSTTQVRYVPDSQNGETATFSFRAWDQTSGSASTNGSPSTADASSTGGSTAFSSNSASASIAVSAVNDAPVFANLDGTPSFTEGGSAVVLDANVTLSDVELGNDFSGSQLVIARNGGASADDVFSFAENGFSVSGGDLQSGGQTFATFTSTGGTLTITFSNAGAAPTQALVNATLQNIQYRNTSDGPPATVQLDWSFDDGNAGDAQGSGANPGTASGSTTVTIAQVNDPPSLTVPGSITVTEDVATALTGISVSDDDAGSGSVTVTLSIADGTLAATSGGGVTVGGSATALTLSGTVSAINSFITGSNVTYTTASDSTAARTLTVAVDDGGNTGSGGAQTDSETVTINVTAVNDPPAIGGVNGETSGITAGGGAQNVALFDDATVTNPEDPADYNNGSLTISQGSGTTNGSWGLDGTTATAGGDGTIAAGETISVGGTAIGTVHATNDGQGGNTLQISFDTADATSARIQTLLRALTYSAPSSLGARTFTLTLNDGGGTSNGGDQDSTANFTLNVTPNPPVVSNLDGDSVSTPNGVAVAIDQGGNATVSDADSGNFNGGNMTITRNSGTGNFSLTGSGSTGVAAGTSTLDADGTIASSEIVFVDGLAIASVSAVNNGQGTNDLVLNFGSNATPARVQQLIRALQFSSTTGGSNSFSLTITDAGSSAATSTAAGFTVTVEAAPVNTVPGAQSVVDGSTTAIAGLSVADADSASVTTTLSVGGGTLSVATGGGATVTGNGSGTVTVSGTLAQVNTALAGLSYTAASDSTTDQTITVVTSDGTNSDTDTIAVTVRDRPTIGNLDGDTVDGSVGTAANVDLGGDATLADLDNADFNNGNLTVTRTDTALTGDFSVDGTAVTANGGSAITNGATIRVGGTAIGTVSADGQDAANLVIDLNPNASPALVQTLLRNLLYTPETTGTHRFSATITDDGGGGATTSAAASFSMTTNDAPVNALPGRLSAVEGIAGNLGGLTVADSDGDVLTTTLRISGGTLSVGEGGGTVTGNGTGTLAISGTAAQVNARLASLRFTADPGVTGNRTLSVSTSDGQETDSDAVTVSIARNEAPSIVTNSGPTLGAGETVVLGPSHLGSSDPEGATAFTYHLRSTPGAGDLLLNGSVLGVGDSFTSADLAAGRVAFRAAAGTTATADSFQVASSDGVRSSEVARVEVTITQGADSGTGEVANLNASVLGQDSTLQTGRQGPANLVFANTGAGNLQLAFVETGQPPQTVNQSLTGLGQGNSPLSQAFRSSVEGGSLTPGSASFLQVVRSAALSPIISDFVGAGFTVLVYSGNSWIPIGIEQFLTDDTALFEVEGDDDELPLVPFPGGAQTAAAAGPAPRSAPDDPAAASAALPAGDQATGLSVALEGRPDAADARLASALAAVTGRWDAPSLSLELARAAGSHDLEAARLAAALSEVALGREG